MWLFVCVVQPFLSRNQHTWETRTQRESQEELTTWVSRVSGKWVRGGHPGLIGFAMRDGGRKWRRWYKVGSSPWCYLGKVWFAVYICRIAMQQQRILAEGSFINIQAFDNSRFLYGRQTLGFKIFLSLLGLISAWNSTLPYSGVFFNMATPCQYNSLALASYEVVWCSGGSVRTSFFPLDKVIV